MTLGGLLRLGGELAVGRLGYGAMQLPGPQVGGPPADRDAALAVLRRAVELGVTHIDTSDAYGPHVANDLIKQALHPYPDDLVIATKVGIARDEWRSFNAAARPAELREQVEENLARLGRARLDLVYLRVGGDGLLHPDETPFAESFAALAELRERGLIRHLGLSGVTVEQLKEAREIAPVAAVQNRYHLLDRGAEDVLRACAEQGVAFVPYFPLSAGLLKPGLDTSRLPPGMAPTAAQERTLDAVAARHGATRPQVALAWLLARSPVVLAIPGTGSPAHLEENVAAAGLRLTPDDQAALDAL
ncbi:oxidoreductase [Nonomuraea zeae]|uniref:Oxidoreductase n=1 Tax=Nonomuraea zeae TaxID=1642303 RepID=A0A5S4GR62_9ACTN|nr:oxidoreductase [Nonomuraea zeae]TMR35367.1 oxidoreductase [Nonomuraea zeae]